MGGARTALALVSIAAFLVCGSPRGETFRWTDAQGNVHYSDRVAPEDVKHPRALLNQQGMQIGTQEGEKSAQQLALEKRLKSLRAEQQRLLSEQRDHDLSLLRSYRSEEEMGLALQNKLSFIENAVKVAESNQQRQNELLLSQQKKAAELEVKGQPVPATLRGSIDATRRQIAGYEDQIGKLRLEKESISADFFKDMARFRLLKSMRMDPLQGLLGGEAKLPAGLAPVDSAISCTPGGSCERIWLAAKDYLQTKSGKPVVTETGKILQTESPTADRDFALIAVRVAGKAEDTIFLDARCRSSSLGDELCASPQVRAILAGFKTLGQ